MTQHAKKKKEKGLKDLKRKPPDSVFLILETI